MQRIERSLNAPLRGIVACMRILAIETSCDETAIAILEADGAFGPAFTYRVLARALFSQASLHAPFGGVFPTLAKREHARNLVPLLGSALQQADMARVSTAPIRTLRVDIGEICAREPELVESLTPFLKTHEKPAIDCLAVTVGPGLEPALWVGINFAKALARAWDLPVIAVNHMEGHVLLPMMHEGRVRPFSFPLLSLLISGGHTELILSSAFGSYARIGETRDDAAGEAFDKVARLLDLPYPGGPEVSRLAAEARHRDLKAEFIFTRPMLREVGYDFSFSGLKTAVRNEVQKEPLTRERKAMIAREFEECVADTLITKTLRAVEEYGVSSVLVGGGVSANTYIRNELGARLHAADDSASLLIPSPELATDNAEMIALAGYFHARRGRYARPEDLVANGNLRLETVE